MITFTSRYKISKTKQKLNKPLTFLENLENRNNFKHFFKTDSELAVDDDLVLKSNRIVIPSDLQNHVIPLTH